MNLNRILEKLAFYKKIGEGNPEITSVENDSRKIVPGSLFICIKGYTVDGHDLVGGAIEKGAVAILTERELEVPAHVIQVVVKDTQKMMARVANIFYDYPSTKFHLTGITGTNGKTTTAVIVEQILRAAGNTTGLIGTMYNQIGDEKFHTVNTTPDSLTLQKIFRQMNESSVSATVMEVSSHALSLGRTHGTDFDIAVFTNFTQDHLDYHQTMDHYRNSKSLLFSQLGNNFQNLEGKCAILNADDEATRFMAEATAAHVLTYGVTNDADVRATKIEITPSGSKITVESIFGNFEINTKMVGIFNVYNVLTGVCVALVKGIPLETVLKTVEEIEGVPGRFEAVHAGQDFGVIVDYAHTAESLEAALMTIKQFAKGNVYCIIGCGGDRDKTKRPLMAKVAVEMADFAIFTEDNPRTENPVDILNDMIAGVEGLAFTKIQDRREAIQYAVSEAQSGDIILIAGKGHEDYQIIGKEKIYFDDRVEARNAITHFAK